jgi:hypothetical protein
MLDGMSRHNVRRDCEDTGVSRHVVQEVETAVQPIANINECQVHIPAGQSLTLYTQLPIVAWHSRQNKLSQCYCNLYCCGSQVIH